MMHMRIRIAFSFVFCFLYIHYSWYNIGIATIRSAHCTVYITQFIYTCDTSFTFLSPPTFILPFLFMFSLRTQSRYELCHCHRFSFHIFEMRKEFHS